MKNVLKVSYFTRIFVFIIFPCSGHLYGNHNIEEAKSFLTKKRLVTKHELKRLYDCGYSGIYFGSLLSKVKHPDVELTREEKKIARHDILLIGLEVEQQLCTEPEGQPYLSSLISEEMEDLSEEGEDISDLESLRSETSSLRSSSDDEDVFAKV
jgi:hypothetical protein